MKLFKKVATILGVGLTIFGIGFAILKVVKRKENDYSTLTPEHVEF